MSDDIDFSQFIDSSDDSTDYGGESRNILYATGELAPYAKAGGLGDVAAALPGALSGQGHTVSVFTPLYGDLDPEELRLARRLSSLSVPRKGKRQQGETATIWEGRVDRNVRVFFVEHDDYFGHEGVYAEDDPPEDVAARWAFFSRAAVEFVNNARVPVDVLHCNDWHTALSPVYLEHYYSGALDSTGTVLTIHNIAYQGTFPVSAFDSTGLPQTFRDENELLHDGELNYLKGGIQHADAVTTVSPTHAEEIQTEEGGAGLDGVLAERDDAPVGILNGADYGVWSPTSDRTLAFTYDEDSLDAKNKNKLALQNALDLQARPDLPLFGFVGRLAEQKGLDLLMAVLEDELADLESPRDGFQAVILGEGDDEYADRLRDLADRYPDRVAVRIGFDEDLAHEIVAGADAMMIPSRYEPCGLVQLHAMRYGTLPVAHATGGLADTIDDIEPVGEGDAHSGSGFLFDDYTEEAFAEALNRAIDLYRPRPRWRSLVRDAMSRRFDWARAAADYAELYADIFDDEEAERAAE